MKKRNIAAVIMTTLVLATGCGAKEPAKTPAPSKAETEAVKNEETVKSEESANVPAEREDAETSSITGTIEDIKDFMFTIVDGADAYSLSFDEKPKGLSDVKEGDKVTVTYTGDLSVVDAFTGTVISVERAAK